MTSNDNTINFLEILFKMLNVTLNSSPNIRSLNQALFGLKKIRQKKGQKKKKSKKEKIFEKTHFLSLVWTREKI